MGTLTWCAGAVVVGVEERTDINQRIGAAPRPVTDIVGAVPGRSLPDRLLELHRTSGVQHEPANQTIGGHRGAQRTIRLDRLGQLDQGLGTLTPHPHCLLGIGHRQRSHDRHHLDLLGAHDRLHRWRARRLQRRHLTGRQHTLTRSFGDRRELVQEPATMHQRVGVTVRHPTLLPQPRSHRHRPIHSPLATAVEPARGQRQPGRFTLVSAHASTNSAGESTISSTAHTPVPIPKAYRCSTPQSTRKPIFHMVLGNISALPTAVREQDQGSRR